MVRHLPKSENETVMNEVNELLNDGLKLRDVTVESAEKRQIMLVNQNLEA